MVKDRLKSLSVALNGSFAINFKGATISAPPPMLTALNVRYRHKLVNSAVVLICYSQEPKVDSYAISQVERVVLKIREYKIMLLISSKAQESLTHLRHNRV